MRKYAGKKSIKYISFNLIGVCSIFNSHSSYIFHMHDVYEYNSYVVGRVAVDGTASLQQGLRRSPQLRSLAWPKLLNMHAFMNCVAA